MTPPISPSRDENLPTLAELGHDLTELTAFRKAISLLLPFLAIGLYVFTATRHWWPLAVLSVMVLSFVTYGSTSHDLVHRNLHLPRRFNDALLTVIELLSLRSGMAYRLSHLHHHHALLNEDDIEGAAARGSLLAAIFGGIVMQPRLWIWAWQRHPRMRGRLGFEAACILALLGSALLALRWTIVPGVYVALVVAGSWLFPLVTVYIPHDAAGKSSLTRTRVFRGRLVQLIAFEHLYHLEHHLYPGVPHHHWRMLAHRLDPHLARAGVHPACGQLHAEGTIASTSVR